MKRTLILFYLLFFFFQSQSQTQIEASSDSDEPVSEVYFGGSLSLQQERRDIIKRIKQIDSHISQWNDYQYELQDHMERIESLRTDIDSTYLKLERSIQNNDTATTKKLTAELIDLFLQPISQLAFISRRDLFYERSSFDDDELVRFSRDVSKKIRDVLGASFQRNSMVDRLIRNYERALYGEDDQFDYSITAGDLESIKSSLPSQKLGEIQKNLQETIKDSSSRLNEKLNTLNSDLEQANSDKDEIEKKLNEKETNINDLAIRLGLPLFCGTIVLLFLGPLILRSVSRKGDSSEAYPANVLLELITVLLLTMSILILGLSGKISEEVLGTLIGGISGYVLNRVRLKPKDDNSSS